VHTFAFVLVAPHLLRCLPYSPGELIHSHRSMPYWMVAVTVQQYLKGGGGVPRMGGAGGCSGGGGTIYVCVYAPPA